METNKGVPPRAEYVLEAHALKEARDDPRSASAKQLKNDRVDSQTLAHLLRFAFLIYAVLVTIRFLRSPRDQDKSDKQLGRVLTAMFGRLE